MIGLTVLRAVFPSPRRRAGIRDLLPLILFLVVFGGTCVALDLLGFVLFVRPSAFILSVVTPWICWMQLADSAGLSRVRSQTALGIRLVMVAGFIVALAEPRAIRTSEVLSVMYAVDVSDSVGQVAIDAALTFVAGQVSEKPATDEAGLVLFGESAVVELPPRITFPFQGVVTSQVRRDATNIAEALSLSAAMIPAEHNGRIVLISDGTSTAGDLARRLDELRSRDIAVDVLPIEYQYANEVWIERLDLPQQVKLAQDYEASVVISSLRATTGTLVLRENGRVVAENELTLRAGLNQFSLPIRVTEPGYYEYQAAIEVPDGEDNLKQNNAALNFLFVEGSGKVLIVTAPGGDSREWEPLAEALTRNGRIIEQRDAYAFPDNTLALMPYDVVVFVNVPANDLVPTQMQALHDAIRDAGIGFLMVGGSDSFGPGGYRRTPVEKALPVSMDSDQQDILTRVALVIILHTCEFTDGKTWGKRITNQAIRVLSDQDEVGVLVFNEEPTGMEDDKNEDQDEEPDGDKDFRDVLRNRPGGNNREKWLFRLTPAVHFPRLVTLVNGATIGDLPTFATTMEMALVELSDSEATIRKVLIISDGDPSAPTDELMAKFQKQKIPVSTVTVSPHGEADITAMKRIAEATGGTNYTPRTSTELPSIFVKEARTLKRSMIKEQTVVPLPGTPSSLLTVLQSPPALHGYVLTSLKPRAEPVLMAPLENDEAETNRPPSSIPILARWKFGLGTTAAFTSDLTTRWGRDWVRWENYDSAATKLITSLSRVRQPLQLRLWTHVVGGDVVITAEDFTRDNAASDAEFTDVAAVLNGPDDYSESVRLQQVSPRRFQIRIPVPGQGRYQVVARGTGDDRTETVAGGFIVSYSPEYIRFRSDPITLERIRRMTHGELLRLTSPAAAVFGDRQPKSSTLPIFDWLLVSLAILLPMDVAVRRLHVDWFAVRRFLFRRSEGDNQVSTLGTLLLIRQDTDAAFTGPGTSGEKTTWRDQSKEQNDHKDSHRPEITAVQTSKDRTLSPSDSRDPDRPAESAEMSADHTTLARLLAIKRQRLQDESGDQEPFDPTS